MLAPLPAVLVTCAHGEQTNLLTIAWTGIVCTNPPMTYVSVRPERHSYDLIRQSGAFTINLVGRELVQAADYCGVRSGRNEDKFAACQLETEPGVQIPVPQLAASPLCLECRVTEVKELGTHHMFLAEIVGVYGEADLFDDKDRFALEQAGLVSYSHGHYYSLEKRPIGRFGYSVMKEKTRKREAQKARPERAQKARPERAQRSRKGQAARSKKK